ncbi:MAG: hypothetical protein H6703_07445 [Myxococcales bacterium]|nr:hypothetical protein [Myxococcales bacterium]
MPLSHEFLDLAARLVALDPRPPRVITLRRAVSAAYYGVFHRLVGDAITSTLGPTPPVATDNPDNPMRLRIDHRVSRWFTHTRMKTVSGWFRQPARAPRPIQGMLTAGADSFVPPSLQLVAKYFVDLQLARHAADYDPAHRLTRIEAHQFVAKAKDAFTLCDQLAGHAMYRLYLLLLLTGDEVARDRA